MKIHENSILQENPYGKVNLERLIELENHLGQKLPKDYRNYLLSYNGGSFKYTTFCIIDEDYSVLSHMYRFTNENDYFDLLSLFEKKIFYMENMLSIADDMTGNQIVISLKENEFGHIYFYDMDGYANLIKISNSFTEFVNELVDLYDVIDYADEVEKIIKTNDISSFQELLNTGYDIEKTDEYNSNLLEQVTINGKYELIKILLEQKPNIRRALDIAKENYKYFPEDFESVVNILEEYKRTQK